MSTINCNTTTRFLKVLLIEKRVMEMDVGDSCATLLIYLIPLYYTLKMVKIVNLMLCVFYIKTFFENKKKKERCN